MTFLIIGGSMLLLTAGYFIAGKQLKGSCGGYAAKLNGEGEVECGFCGRKGDEIAACSDGDETRETV